MKLNGKIIYRVCFSRNGYTRKDGTRQIVIMCTQNSKTTQINTKIYVLESQFKDGFVCNHSLFEEYNRYIYKLKENFERLELEAVLNNKQVTLSMFKRQIKDGVRRNMTLSEFVEAVNNTTTVRTKKTKATYTTLIRQVEKFEKGITIDDVNVDFINTFIKWNKDNKMSHNTIVGRLKALRAMVNEAIKRGLIKLDDDPFRFIKIPSMINREEYLTDGEVKKIEELSLTGKEKRVRDAFVFACYTGFRFSDLNTIKNEHIKMIDGNKWIVKKPLKTMRSSNITVRIPIYSIFDGKPLKMIERYNGNVERLTHVGDNAIANKILKTVLAKTNIENLNKRHITFHCARHTAATLLLQHNVPMTTIQKILGHTKLTTTQIYAKVDDSVVDRDVKAAFVGT